MMADNGSEMMATHPVRDRGSPAPADFVALRDRGVNGPGRYLIGCAVTLFAWLVVGSVVAVVVVLGLTGQINPLDPDVNPIAGYVALNLSFWPLIGGLYLAVRWLHHRPFLTLITGAPAIDWRRVGLGFGLYLALTALAALVEALLYPGRYRWSLDAARFAPFALVVLALTPIQTTAEELLFRGYLLQALGGLVRHPIALSVLNGVLFMLPHLGNPEFAGTGNAVALAANYLLIGVLLAAVTLRSGTAELAIGAHAANNLFAALIANYPDGALRTESVFTVAVLDPVFGLLSLAVVGVVYYGLLFRVGRFGLGLADTPRPALSPSAGVGDAP